jgi:hypothetical protein
MVEEEIPVVQSAVDTGEATAQELDLETRGRIANIHFERVSEDTLVDLFTPLVREPLKPPKGPAILELSARYPYNATLGRLDCYQPGRWDTESNLIYMDPIVQTGPSPGEWDGSVLYGTFNPPANGYYIFAVNFTGWNCTMYLGGPWGTKSAYTALTTDSGVVAALWAGNAPMGFGMSCKGSGLGFVASVQVFALS